jgi:hypothetical protein
MSFLLDTNILLMLVHGVTHILTFNVRDFRRYREITAVLPTDIVNI